jgi:hypothetical protein
MAMAFVAFAGFGLSFLRDSKEEDSVAPWNLTQDHYIFSSELTDLIDEILITTSLGGVTQKKVVGESRKIPATGVHYFYDQPKHIRGWYSGKFHYIILDRKTDKINNEKVEYYRCYVGGVTVGKQAEILGDFIKKLFRTTHRKVRVISIDTSGVTAKAHLTTVKYAKPLHHQRLVIDWILKKYKEDQNNNVKIIICGTRGSGKTFTSRGIKKKYEEDNSSHFVKLFHNFDPTNIGVDINSLVLSQSSEVSPVIVQLDEIDVIFEDALKHKNIMDTRTHHTRNKKTLLQMLDAVGDTLNVLSIGTTELTPEQLYEHPEWHSFMRPGRIDYFVRFTKDPSRIEFLTHDQIEGYHTD